MSDWKVYLVEQLGKVITGYTPATSDTDGWEGKVPFYSPSDFGDKVYCSSTERTIASKSVIFNRTVYPDTIMVTCIGSTIGKMAIVQHTGITNQQINALICSDEFNPVFTFYNLKYNIHKLYALRGATAIPIVNKSQFSRIPLPFPPISTQRKIARILSTIDGQIEKTEAIIAKYQAVKQGMLQDLFTRGIDVHTGLLRPRYEDAPDLYQDSPLGMIPKDWEVTTIGRACLIQNQFRKPISSEIRETMPGKYPYYGPTGIQDYIDEFRVKGRYVLIGEDGDHFLKWSKQEMTLLIDGEFNVNNHAHILEGTEECLTEWIHTYFAHRDITFYLTRQGAGRYKLNKAALRSILFPLPSVTEQQMLIERLTSINSRIKLDKEALSKLQVLKQGMMQDLLSGRVEVNA